ncbi:MAG: DUF938 domain-containing protein [Rubrivivax sp.]
MDKPFSEACARNQAPILQVLRTELADARQLLEIGSGTGQHAVHFAAALPHLSWQCSEREEHLDGLRLWLDEARLPNLPAPIVLDVDGAWPRARFDAVFTANTLHIVRWAQVQRLFEGVGQALRPAGVFVAYGPFNIDGRFTSAGNARFDALLRAEDPQRGLRDIAALDTLALHNGLQRSADHAMPANNRCLVWRRPPA